jgi:hypothetical protein
MPSSANVAAERRRAGGQMSSNTVGASVAPARAARCTRMHTWRPTSTASRSLVGAHCLHHARRPCVHSHAVRVESMVILTPRSPFECRQAADSGACDATAAGRCDAGPCRQGRGVRGGMCAVGAGLQPRSAARRQQLQCAATACTVRGRLRAAPLAGRAAGVCGGCCRQARAANILLDAARGVSCRPWVRGGSRA